LAVLVKRFPRLSETFVLNEFLELRRQGLSVRLYAVMDPSETAVQPEAAALRHEVGYLRPGSWLAMVPGMAGAAWRHRIGLPAVVRLLLSRRSLATLRHCGKALVLVDELDRIGAVHLHAHFAHGPAAVAYLAHLVSGIPFSFTAHANDLYTTPVGYIAQRSAAATFVATCTGANRTYLEDTVGADPAKVVVCRHGVDLERFSAVQRNPVPGRLLSIGRLVPKKGFDVLIRACRILADRGVAFECRIIGSGPQRDDLRALVASHGMADTVVLGPSRPQTELLVEYGQAEVFVLCPSVMGDGDRDGIPNVILEAMAVGVPVVATAISGIPEIIEDGRTGCLGPPGDPLAVADMLERLLGDPLARETLSSAGRAFASEHLDLASSVRPLAGRFADLLAHGVGPTADR
jgi:glycosyltransferase involved in cell wall biosynthesis